MHLDAHLAVTDSGLGGLSICAGLERRWRQEGRGRARITYVNAWPFEGRGYNDLPDVPARAAVFDRALDAIAARAPDRILIACNTLSIVYRHTAFRRAAAVPVDGIIDAGVSLFAEALAAAPSAGLVLLGTRTTIESGAHAGALAARGIDPRRLRAVHCHGLAGAIERDPDGAAVSDLVAACAARVREADPAGDPLFAGLCCTHYGYVTDRLCAALADALGRPVRALDPNARMVDGLVLDPRTSGPAGGSNTIDPGPTPPAGGEVAVEVISKVVLPDAARHALARLVSPVSPATARALLSYAHVPDLF